MLTKEQLIHFAEHGWVLLEDVVRPEQCAQYIAALNRVAIDPDLPAERWTKDDLTCFDLDLRHLTKAEDDIFYQWFTLPGILDANRQCAGSELRYQGAACHIKAPHAERHTRGDEIYDPAKFSWHRGSRPKGGTFLDDRDPRLINSLLLNNITYLIPSRRGTAGRSCSMGRTSSKAGMLRSRTGVRSSN
jgi:hypothetical protein